MSHYEQPQYSKKNKSRNNYVNALLCSLDKKVIYYPPSHTTSAGKIQISSSP
jgi:hypothetical protein